jgi:isopentenyldiphosphate isomerase
LTGKDGSKLDVKATITDIYRIKELKDDEFIEMLKDQSNVPEEQKEGLDIDKVKVMFKEHLEKIYQDNYTEEVRSLTFAALNNLTEGIHYNENEITNLKNQFTVQVQKMADQEKTSFADYVIKNFGSQKLMEDYVDASQRARVLQAAIYRKIGKEMGLVPTYMQLESFVKTFLFKFDPTQLMDDALVQQVNQQVTQVLAEPLNRQRIIESWASVKAEDMINDQIGLL